MSSASFAAVRRLPGQATATPPSSDGATPPVPPASPVPYVAPSAGVTDAVLVVCRIRPLLTGIDDGSAPAAAGLSSEGGALQTATSAGNLVGCLLPAPGATSLTVVPRGSAESSSAAALDISTNASANQPQQFTFDRIFGPETQQKDMYEAVGMPVLKSVLAGFNGCVLAYGQTASGKTWTIDGCLSAPQMQALARSGAQLLLPREAAGPTAPAGGVTLASLNAAAAGTGGHDTSRTAAPPSAAEADIAMTAPERELASRAGLIPRLILGLFDAIARHETGDETTFSVSCQHVEIYQEGLRDLLQMGIASESKRIGVRNAGRESLSGRAQGGRATPSLDLTIDGDAVADGEAADVGELEGPLPPGGEARRGPTPALGDPDLTVDSAAASVTGSRGVDASSSERLQLLQSAVSSGRTTPAAADTGALQIREDPQRGVFVAGAAQLPVTEERHVFEALALGASHRATAATRMNERSSRSHSVFQLYIMQKRLDSMTTVRSTLTIVDLAGSERVGWHELLVCAVWVPQQSPRMFRQVAKTGAVGARLDEAKKILFSLHALSNVINALTDGRSSHIPYRDSKCGN
jgi:hypothetical protein